MLRLDTVQNTPAELRKGSSLRIAASSRHYVVQMAAPPPPPPAPEPPAAQRLWAGADAGSGGAGPAQVPGGALRLRGRSILDAHWAPHAGQGVYGSTDTAVNKCCTAACALHVVLACLCLYLF